MPADRQGGETGGDRARRLTCVRAASWERIARVNKYSKGGNEADLNPWGGEPQTRGRRRPPSATWWSPNSKSG